MAKAPPELISVDEVSMLTNPHSKKLLFSKSSTPWSQRFMYRIFQKGLVHGFCSKVYNLFIFFFFILGKIGKENLLDDILLYTIKNINFKSRKN